MKKTTECSIFGLGLTCMIITAMSSRKFRFILGCTGVGLLITCLPSIDSPQNTLTN